MKRTNPPQPSMTIDQLEALDPCTNGMQFAQSCKSLSEAWRLCVRSDWMIWLLRKMRKMDKPTSVRIAVACALRVLPFYESKHPGDLRPRKAIESAEAWLRNPCNQTASAAAASAYVASAAASAYVASAAASAYVASADASASADAAASASASAADAAAYVASAAATSADAAAYVAASAYVTAASAASASAERKWQADKIRELVSNPFEA